MSLGIRWKSLVELAFELSLYESECIVTTPYAVNANVGKCIHVRRATRR